MAFFNRNKSVTIKADKITESKVYGTQDRQPSEADRIGKELDILRSSLTVEDIYDVSEKDLQLALEYGLTIFNESTRYAILQKLQSPWLQSPGMVALMNKVCNKIAALPMYQQNKKTGEKKPLPKIFDFPVGKDNPSYNSRWYRKQSISSLYRFGDLITYLEPDSRGRVKKMIPTSAERVRIKGDIESPKYDFYPGSLSLLGTEATIRRQTMEGVSPRRVLHVSNMPAPETFRGVPVGLMISQNVAAILGSQSYTARFFSDANWQQTLFHPPYQMDNFEMYQTLMENLMKGTKANHSTLFTDAPVEVKNLGHSPKDAMLVEMLKSAYEVFAVAHGVPVGMISPDDASFAALYVESQMFVSDVAEPIITDYNEEHTRVLPGGREGDWEVCMDTTRLWDPKTLLDMMTQASKAGFVSVNRACEMLGWEPFGDPNDEKNIFNRPTTDGNRVPVDMLEKLAESKTAKKQSPGNPGGDKSPEREEPPAPSDE